MKLSFKKKKWLAETEAPDRRHAPIVQREIIELVLIRGAIIAHPASQFYFGASNEEVQILFQTFTRKALWLGPLYNRPQSPLRNLGEIHQKARVSRRNETRVKTRGVRIVFARQQPSARWLSVGVAYSRIWKRSHVFWSKSSEASLEPGVSLSHLCVMPASILCRNSFLRFFRRPLAPADSRLLSRCLSQPPAVRRSLRLRAVCAASVKITGERNKRKRKKNSVWCGQMTAVVKRDLFRRTQAFIL